MKKHNLTVILIALAIADFLGAIDSTGLNVALPKITSTMHLSITSAQWIPNAFILALVSLLIFAGKLGDKIGAKKLYITGLLFFGLSSLALGFVNNFQLLVVIRAIQGISTAILYTMPMAIIANLWKDREKAFAVTSATFAGGMLVGPVLGGILANHDFGNFYGWHLVFLLNIPFVLFGLFISSKYLPETPKRKDLKLDYVSVGLVFTSLLIITLSFSIISLWYIILGIILLAMLYFWQKKIKNSLLDFHLFREQTFLSANLVSFFSMVTIIGMSFVLTFYFQNILGWSPIKAGFALLPVPIITGVFSMVGGQLKNWKAGAFLSSGLILAGLILLTFAKPEETYFLSILPGLALVSAGGGFLMTSIFAAILGSAPTEKSGSASGILNTFQQLGALIGIAVISSITLNHKLAFTILVFFGILALSSAFFVKQNKIFKTI